MLLLFNVYYYSNPLHYLDSDINWSFLNNLIKPHKWVKVDDNETFYYYRKYKNGGKNFTKVYNLLNKMYLNNIGILNITAIYNPNLTSSFINQVKIFNDRFINNHDLFFTKTYLKSQSKLNVIDHYNNNVVTLLESNKNKNIPIIPSLHGTDLDIAYKIAESGFCKLSSSDAGWFAAGIYQTSSVCYCLPYACGRRDPAIILSYLCLGHVFPVDEDHLDKQKTLLGAALKAGYSSHYVLSTKNGHVYKSGSDYQNGCDEIVVNLENQCLPAFIISLNPESALKEYEHWERVVPIIKYADIRLEI